MISAPFKKNTLARRVLIYFAVGTAVAIFNSIVVITTILAENHYPNLLEPIISELTGGYSFSFILPFMLYIFKKFPLGRNNNSKSILIYFAAFIPAGIFHISFMYASRSLIYPLLGWGNYDYGIMGYRIIMEYAKLSTGIFMAYLITSLYRSIIEKEEEKVNRARLEEQLTKTRLEALKSRLNPHFLFNTLNMISSAMYDDVKTADKMISNLSLMLRASLQTDSSALHTLREELELLKLFVEIMKERFKDKLDIEFRIDDSSSRALIPHFLLQPLIENSIKHGMESLHPLKIILRSYIKDNFLFIEIEDNGPGINIPRELVFKKGVGLSNCYERLTNYYGTNSYFEWHNTVDGVIFEIQIPFKEADNG